MSDWQVGDLAVCVDAQSALANHVTGLVEGRSYEVRGVYVPGRRVTSAMGTPAELGLYLAGLRSDSTSGAFDERRFRKVRPDAHEACETDFIVLLNRIKRKVEA